MGKCLKKKYQLKYQKLSTESIIEKSIRKYIIMSEENISEEFRLENIDETRNFLIEEINRNELMSKKHKKVCTSLNYIEHFLD